MQSFTFFKGVISGQAAPENLAGPADHGGAVHGINAKPHAKHCMESAVGGMESRPKRKRNAR